MSTPMHSQNSGSTSYPDTSYSYSYPPPEPITEVPEDPDIVRVNPDMLTIGEVEEVEELAGQSIDTFARPGSPKAKFMRAMGMMMRRRTDPSFTWEQSYRLKVRIDSDNQVPPTSGNGSDPSQSLPGSTA
jgi:hypothetical protein